MKAVLKKPIFQKSLKSSREYQIRVPHSRFSGKNVVDEVIMTIQVGEQGPRSRQHAKTAIQKPHANSYTLEDPVKRFFA